MKILLLGDFSNLHGTLKDGLINLGHEVDLASSGDGWKQIKRDIDLSVSGRFSKIKRRVKYLSLLNTFKNYDVVQIINPFIIPFNYFPFKYFYRKLKSNNHKVFLLAAGDDAYFWKYARQELKYSPIDDYLKYDLKIKHHYLESEKFLKLNKYVADNVNGIIPCSYSYSSAYRLHKNIKEYVPLPIDINSIGYKKNLIKDEKIVVFHGLNRYGFKGTKYVEQAFDYLKDKYQDKLELIIDGKMPLDDYLKLLRRSNIVIDQVNSYGWGMNALYAMAMGKVVMGGAEDVVKETFGLMDCPIINIKPDSNDIINKIENIIKNEDQIEEIGRKSREFVEIHHSPRSVSNQYLDIWKNN